MRVEYMVDDKSQITVSYSKGNPLYAGIIRITRFGFAADEELVIHTRDFGQLERLSKTIRDEVWKIKEGFIERAKQRRASTPGRRRR